MDAPRSPAGETESGPEIPSRKLVFVGGLHRGGTTPLARALASHPDASGFANTGVPEDEGQHLQSVYPRARALGGPGVFGFDPRARMTEESPEATPESAARLLRAWAPHWDATRAALIEKSPPNLLKTRFLQALFPDAAFVLVVRHPIAVSMATSKWSGTSLVSLVEHWLKCHEILEEDLPRLRRALVVAYEDFVADAPGILGKLFERLGLPPANVEFEVRPGLNEAYFEQWGRESGGDAELRARLPEFEARVGRFGYSLVDPFRLRREIRSEALIRHGLGG